MNENQSESPSQPSVGDPFTRGLRVPPPPPISPSQPPSPQPSPSPQSPQKMPPPAPKKSDG
jgi:hypothetical protein